MSSHYCSTADGRQCPADGIMQKKSENAKDDRSKQIAIATKPHHALSLRTGKRVFTCIVHSSSVHLYPQVQGRSKRARLKYHALLFLLLDGYFFRILLPPSANTTNQFVEDLVNVCVGLGRCYTE
jgi:hypothetical protein